ncbi:MAG TPA: ABC transporter permease subunit, partial [Actinomycetaceae bacterium]|nr:ABC transporter permease subunit [Actinomycetaceae bacterium]
MIRAGRHLRDVLAQQRRLSRMRAMSPVILGAIVLGGWQLIAHLQIVSPVFLPAPTAVAVRLWHGIVDGNLLGYTWVTLTEAVLGSLLGAAVALPLGYAVARNRWAAAALQPFIAGSQALPAVALAPLLVIWVGYGLLPIVLLCSLLVFFPILLATVLGLRTLDPDVMDAARLDGATGWWLIRHVEIPMAAPSLLTGIRNGV